MLRSLSNNFGYKSIAGSNKEYNYMREERITITINEDGSLNVKTDGIKGEACLEEVNALLDELSNIKEIKKTDEFNQKINTQNKNTLKGGIQ